MQAKKFGETSWAIKKNVSCDCENIAVKGLVSEEECIHSKAIIISPMQAKLAVPILYTKKYILALLSSQWVEN